MKFLIALGAMIFALAAAPVPTTYQYKDISAKTARPIKERAPANVKHTHRNTDARKVTK